MKKITLLICILLMMLSCGESTFTIKCKFDERLQVPDDTEISINIKNGDGIITHVGIVKDNQLILTFDIPEEQLVVLDLGELGSTIIAIEDDKISSNKVNITVEPNIYGEVVITKEGTTNNDFIQMYEDCEAQIYYLDTNVDTNPNVEDKIESIIHKVYRTLKGDENSLTDINTLAGKYGFTEFYSVFDLEQLDTLCSLMNENTLKDATMLSIYNMVQRQKELSTGKKYVNISASTPDGTTLALSDLVSKTDYVLVDFWASWCGPCRASMPKMKAFYNQHQDQVQILGVSLDNDKDAWIAAISTLQLNWYHISDLQGWQSEGAKTYAVNAIPCTLLIDKEGTIIGRDIALEEIEKLLNE